MIPQGCVCGDIPHSVPKKKENGKRKKERKRGRAIIPWGWVLAVHLVCSFGIGIFFYKYGVFRANGNRGEHGAKLKADIGRRRSSDLR